MSKAEVGSSSTTKRGFGTSARAIAMRRYAPLVARRCTFNSSSTIWATEIVATSWRNGSLKDHLHLAPQRAQLALVEGRDAQVVMWTACVGP